jgi:hypothetical protein
VVIGEGGGLAGIELNIALAETIGDVHHLLRGDILEMGLAVVPGKYPDYLHFFFPS